MSTKELVYSIDEDLRKIINLEGSCEKYCINIDFITQYFKFCNFYDVFSEVFISQLLNQIGYPCVPYVFANEKTDDGVRTGTKSSDFSVNATSRVSLYTMAEDTKMINPMNDIDAIYIDLPKVMKVLERFCKIHNIKIDEEERKEILTLLESQIVIDYVMCNSDHHLKNTEFLIYIDQKQRKRIMLAPMFDLGQTLRSANVNMAFTFKNLGNEGLNLRKTKQTPTEMYAKHVIEYFKNKYKNPKDLANDYAFRLLCYFQYFNFEEELFKFLCSIDEDYKYFKFKNIGNIDEEYYYEIINNVIENLKKILKIDNSFHWTNMKMAFEERQRAIYDCLCEDKFFCGESFDMAEIFSK